MNSSQNPYLLKEIDMKLNALSANLAALDVTLTKAKVEILTRIAELETALVDADIPQDAVDALAALSATATSLDDIIPDLP